MSSVSQAKREEVQIRPEDIRTFLAAYDHARPCQVAKQRDTYLHLFEGLEEKHTTVLDRLERIAKFFFDRPVWENLGRRSEVCLLFDKRPQEDVLRPTPAADALYKQLLIMSELYETARQAVRKALSDEKRVPVVRMGSIQSFGQYLIPYIFGSWGSRFGHRIDLKMEIASSVDLMPRLDAGLLDCVFALGAENKQTAEEDPPLVFEPVGFPSRMVLLCHPQEDLRTKRGAKPNKGYWKKKFRGAERPSYEDLTGITLREIDFSRTPLIVVRSWGQPKGLKEFLEKEGPRILVKEVSSYDEALALVRTGGLGVVVAIEVFARRRYLTAFRLEPEHEFTRWIGVYRSQRRDLEPHARCVIDFIRSYFAADEKFAAELRKGTPIAFDHPDYVALCNRFKKTPEWAPLLQGKPLPKAK